MRIVCPKCELKGQIDAAPRGAKTRIACVRCATTFDAVFAGGEIQAVLPQAGHGVATIESAGIELHTAAPAVTVTGAETMPLPEMPHDENPFDYPLAADEDRFDASLPIASPPAAAELDDLFASSPDLILETPVETTQEAAPQAVAHELMPPTDELTPSSAEFTSETVETPLRETADDVQAPIVMADPVQDPVAVAQPHDSHGAGKVVRPPSDAYSMGVRLMRVSPLWLLLAGLTFISFIVFCNWLIKPSEQPGDGAGLMAAANNHATNQSANRATPASTTTAQSPVNRQVNPSSDVPGVAFIPTEAKEAPHAVPAVAPNVPAAVAKPAVEEKPAAPSPTSSRSGGAQEGRVTVQVGSYNVAAEAEKLVGNLKSAGIEARSVKVEIPKRGTWYRVQSGRFVSRAEAERYGRQLRDKGVVSSFLTTDMQE